MTQLLGWPSKNKKNHLEVELHATSFSVSPPFFFETSVSLIEDLVTIPFPWTTSISFDNKNRSPLSHDSHHHYLSKMNFPLFPCFLTKVDVMKIWTVGLKIVSPLGSIFRLLSLALLMC